MLPLLTLLVHLASSASPGVLRPNIPIERDLASGEGHVYEAVLDAEPWLVNVEQYGTDVVIEASGPAGDVLAVDVPTYRRGPETLVLQPAVAGRWRIELRARNLGVGPGRYEIQLEGLAGDGALQRSRIAAEAAMAQAGQLHFQGTAGAKKQAIAVYREALEHWRVAGADRRRAWTLLAIAILHRQLAESREAQPLYEEAAALFHELGEDHGEAIALNDLGLCASDLSQLEDARAYLQQALDLQRRLGDDYGAAMARNNLCLEDHRRGELRLAEDCYEQVLASARQGGERIQEALVLSNLGNVYDRLGEPGLAIDAYRRSLSIRQSTGDRKGEAKTRVNLGVLYRRLGEPQEAIGHYTAALAIHRQLGDRRWEARTLSNLGQAYYSLGELERARSFFDRALPMRRAVGDLRGTAVTLNHLGRLHRRLGKPGKARELHRQALEISRQNHLRSDEANTLILLGQSSLAAGDPDAALEVSRRAFELVEKSGDRRKQADVLHQIGEARRRRGDVEQALTSLSRALDHRRAIQDRQGEVWSLGAIAHAEAELGRFDAAFGHVREALKLTEALRSGIVDPDLRAAFTSSQRRAYELEIDLLMRRHELEPKAGHDRSALAASERARARTLVELLQEAGARIRQGIDPVLSDRRASLQQRLDAKAMLRVRLLSRGDVDHDARRELFEVLAELETVEADIRRQSPAYAALTRPDPLSTAEIQELLDPDTMLLEFSLGEERSFLWALTTETSASFELPGREEIEDASRSAHQALSTLDLRDPDSSREPLARLSRLILGPVAGRLLRRRLVVVADGALHYIPFAALPSPAGASPDSVTLLEQHEIVHLPSASALAVQRRVLAGRPQAPGRVAILADPVFHASDSRIRRIPAPATETAPSVSPGALRGGSGTEMLDLGLDRLRASRREANAIAALVPPGTALVALDFAAHRDLVFSGELGRYRIIHFATHGMIDARRPELSGLVLSLVDREGRARDGFLRLRDLYNMRLASDLVVLSGCRTALGREIRGEGLVGLTRGFMYAGAPRVVASLWQVEDQATGELMERFYRAMLVDGLPTAAALRQAQLEVARQRRWSAPFYWAGFVHQGDWL